MNLPVPHSVLKKIKRVQSLECQRTSAAAGIVQALEAACDFYLSRRDPVEKAKRAQRKTEKPKSNSARAELKREPLTAAQKHAVFNRDGGKCTHTDATGKRCGSDKWIQIHHLKPLSQGGSNDPENLTTLCSFHHDLAHQLGMPIEGQVTWLREPVQLYG